LTLGLQFGLSYLRILDVRFTSFQECKSLKKQIAARRIVGALFNPEQQLTYNF
jgi:hypothetical protein